ncbi:hypothetical protein VTH82DRAFT_6666 [Thermothelomyces myriococcoides]
MGKEKMDDAAAQRILRARGEKDGFSKRAVEAARRNGQNSHTFPGDFSSGGSSSSSGGGGGGNDKIDEKGGGDRK